MKIAGNCTLQDIINALQGNFGCTDIRTTKNGTELDDKFVRLELFFLSFEIHYSQSRRLEIYRISEDRNGSKGYVPLLTLRGE